MRKKLWRQTEIQFHETSSVLQFHDVYHTSVLYQGTFSNLLLLVAEILLRFVLIKIQECENKRI